MAAFIPLALQQQNKCEKRERLTSQIWRQGACRMHPDSQAAASCFHRVGDGGGGGGGEVNRLLFSLSDFGGKAIE